MKQCENFEINKSKRKISLDLVRKDFIWRNCCHVKTTEGRTLYNKGLFLIINHQVSQGYLEKVFSFTERSQQSWKELCVWKQNERRGTRKKGWRDQKVGLRMSYPKATISQEDRLREGIVCWLRVRVSQRFQSLGVGDYLNQSLINKHLF